MLERCIQSAVAAFQQGRAKDMVEIRIILVAIDFSDLSDTVIEYANSLAAAWNARLLVVHVVHDLSYFTGIYVTDTPLPELQQRLEAEARERLEAICQAALGPSVPYEALVVTGRPVVEIQRLLRGHDADCLVMGAHSTDKPEHQLFGSTAQRLLHQTACPVFLIPPRKSSEFISQG
jgi:nucleotide-binding universal stress UspA family protein